MKKDILGNLKKNAPKPQRRSLADRTAEVDVSAAETGKLVAAEAIEAMEAGVEQESVVTNTPDDLIKSDSHRVARSNGQPLVITSSRQSRSECKPTTVYFRNDLRERLSTDTQGGFDVIINYLVEYALNDIQEKGDIKIF